MKTQADTGMILSWGAFYYCQVERPENGPEIVISFKNHPCIRAPVVCRFEREEAKACCGTSISHNFRVRIRLAIVLTLTIGKTEIIR